MLREVEVDVVKALPDEAVSRIDTATGTDGSYMLEMLSEVVAREINDFLFERCDMGDREKGW